MRSQPPEDTKLLILPTHLVDRLKAIATRQGVSLSSFAAESLEQALRANEMDASLSDAVDAYRLSEIQRGAGMVDVPRSSLNHLVERLYAKKGEELRRVWGEAGRWYGEYLRAKLQPGEALGFLEKELLVAWNLDEAEVKESDDGGRRQVGLFRYDGGVHGAPPQLSFRRHGCPRLQGGREGQPTRHGLPQVYEDRGTVTN